jgi:phosphate-selective porin OprO/OprP
MKRVIFILMALVVFAAWHVPAMGQTGQEVTDEIKAIKKQMDEMRGLQERLKALEKKLEEAEKVTTQIQKEEAQLKEDKKTRAISYWRDGFNIETPDKQFRLQLAGVLHFDYRQFEQQRSASGFDIRRARYDMRGSLYRGDLEHIFRIQIEMADDPYLRNCYWMFKPSPDLSFSIGQFKVFSGGADWLTEEAQVNFVEYATTSPVSPFFDRGIRIQKNFLGDKVQATVGAFNGTGSDKDLGQGDYDNSKDYVVRLLLAPFKDSEHPHLKGLYLAGSYQDGLQSIKTARDEANNKTENYESQWYKWGGQTGKNYGLDKRKHYGGELHHLWGPATFSYEFNRVEWEDLKVYNSSGVVQRTFPERYHSDVHQVWISYFLTGEQKQMEDVFFAWRQPKPKKNFSLKEGTWGAWELLARYAFHTTSNKLFEGGTNAILQGSSQGYSITGGVRWIWNPKARLMLDITHCKSTEANGVYNMSTTVAQNGTTATRYIDKETVALFRIILTP